LKEICKKARIVEPRSYLPLSIPDIPIGASNFRLDGGTGPSVTPTPRTVIGS